MDIYHIIFVRAVVDSQIITTIILIVIQIIGGIVVIVRGIVVIPRLKIRAVGVIIVVGGVLIQEVFKLNISVVIAGIIRGIVDSIKGLVIAVNDIGRSRVAAPIVVRHVAIFVLYAAGRGSIVFLRFRRRILLI